MNGNLLLTAYSILWLFITLFAILYVKVVRQQTKRLRGTSGGLHGTDKGIEYGAEFPLADFAAINQLELNLGKGQDGYIVLFTAAGCDVCKNIYPHIGTYQKDNPLLKVVVLNLSEDNTDREAWDLIQEYDLEVPVAKIVEEDIFRLSTTVFPFGYALGPDRHVIAKGVIALPADLEALTLNYETYRKAG
ncbi:glutaredoxin family protein [Paenibacillus sp. UNC499MF]|uniref:TlpA family protein disulfide reductase n=1 Tax=Paenibacillus sp. UNC499MF TaxID=1502751 RepID=UPI00089FB67B|nr:glutaredoxin family protein [Paenibacillus sp. UNC499MF]SEF93180.1 Glutaredoxin-like domain [Paenibacillus sp. UNC499MF]